ncbi:MAG: EscV/YscV/HrcV family type III secretion system export apparatus protein [Chitinivibrionales bacterium]|nr:EscV/YscV/HrcV family type III secretion system export apparatus protein [Chitinivibrionales bacterium]MBD3356601.1 EscV/YscV/HrcV family type III secretion system export apparatus protein [Chitinivibrionales bacterium]
MPALQKLFLKINQHSDLLLAAGVVSVIALIILPLPSFIIDTLLATNLAVAVCLLIVALYLPSAISLSTFPTLLLFTTLFRLALNITTTRQILLNGFAGMIIETFGNFVVSGNVIVGFVVFIIITIVQFIVIAKGSERVAEVAARFTLDAMPGKQMSIDADLRAGTIDMKTAKASREAIQKESRMYGAMDGAMKFVKGDAIAGLVVTAINILGGIAIGMLQKGMSGAEAMETYSILTIGDGLVSQIPALFISITAGIIITRVPGAESTHLGGDIGDQVLARPKALMVGGTILLLFALVPGFPIVQFLALGAVIIGVGYSFLRAEERDDMSKSGVSKAIAVKKDESESHDQMVLTRPFVVLIGESLGKTIDTNAFIADLSALRSSVRRELGVPIPRLVFETRKEPSFGTSTLQVAIHEIPLLTIDLESKKYMLLERPEKLLEENAVIEEQRLHRNLTVYWIDEKAAGQCKAAGIAVYEGIPLIHELVNFVMRQYAAEFIGLQETKHMLEQIEPEYPMLVKEIQRLVPLARVAEVFRRLVEEGVSLRNLRAILEALIEWAPKEKDVIMLTEYARIGLRHYITYAHTQGDESLISIILDPQLEEKIRKAIRQTAQGSFLALAPDEVNKINKAIKDCFHKAKSGAEKPPVLISSMDIRRYIKKMIESDIGKLPVLSFQELSTEISVKPVASVSL